MTPRHLDYAPGRWRYRRLTWVTEERVSLGEGRKKKKMNCVSDMWSLRYLWDIQVEMSSRQVEIRAWNSGERSGLEI